MMPILSATASKGKCAVHCTPVPDVLLDFFYHFFQWTLSTVLWPNSFFFSVASSITIKSHIVRDLQTQRLKLMNWIWRAIYTFVYHSKPIYKPCRIGYTLHLWLSGPWTASLHLSLVSRGRQRLRSIGLRVSAISASPVAKLSQSSFK